MPVPRRLVQLHWVNPPSSTQEPSQQYQQGQDIEELLSDQKRHTADEITVRMVDPSTNKLLETDFLVTVLIMDVSDTRLSKDNADVVNELLRDRRSVFLVLKGLADGNIWRFGIDRDYVNRVVVYDLDIVPPPEPEQSVFDGLINQIMARLTAVFDDYPVNNFRLLLQQSRDAELKQAQRSWTLLLMSVAATIVLAVVFIVVGYFTSETKLLEVDELEQATQVAKEQAVVVAAQLSELEDRYEELSSVNVQRQFYSESLNDDYVTLTLGLGELELTQWDFDAEQYFLTNRVDELTDTVTRLCGLLGTAIAGVQDNETSGDVGDWARFVTYCENLHVLSTCNATLQGDGVCQGKNNYHDCNWDGGDCCPGTYCLDGTHVCDHDNWHNLDVSSDCIGHNCSSYFGYQTYSVLSDGVNRYTPSCTSGIEATELVFLATLPPGGLLEMRVTVPNVEVPIFIEGYRSNDAFDSCPVADGGLSPGTGANFVRCSESEDDPYMLIQSTNASAEQHVLFIVDIEDVTPMAVTVEWRNTTAKEIASVGASAFARSQLCQIGKNNGLVGDGTCHSAYNSASCGWDGGDCYCVFGLPTTESFGNGECDSQFENVWSNSRSCGWDGGDCAVDNTIGSSSVSNYDKPWFDNDEILDNFTVYPSSKEPDTLHIARHDRAEPVDEVITLGALPRCQPPDTWVCPIEWYSGKTYVTFDEYYDAQLAQKVHDLCPLPADRLAAALAHFGDDGLPICDCGCGYVDPDCTISGEERDCGLHATIDPLTGLFDPLAPADAVPDTCVCIAL